MRGGACRDVSREHRWQPGFRHRRSASCRRRLAPVPRDAGRISGDLHRPRRFNRRLLPTCYLAALQSEEQVQHRERSTTGNGAKGSLTNSLLSQSPAAASMSSGPCSATTPPTRNRLPPHCSRCLTTALRFPVAGGRAIRGFSGACERTTSSVTCPCGLFGDRAQGSRSARPVRRHASSRLSVTRSSMNNN